VWGAWCLLRGLRDHGRPPLAWPMAAALGAAACYTNYSVIFTISAQAIFLGCVLWRHGGPGPLARRRNEAAGSMVLWLLALLPWLPHLIAQGQLVAGRRIPYKGITGDKALEVVKGALLSMPYGAVLGGEMVTWASSAIVVGLCTRLAWGMGRRGLDLSLAGALPIALLAATSLAVHRSVFESPELVFAQVFWLIGLALLACSSSDRGFCMAAASWLVIACVYLCAENYAGFGRSASPGTRSAVAHLLEHMEPGELLIARGNECFCALRYYAGGRVHPRLCLAGGRPDRLWGTEHLRDDELTTPEALKASAPPGIWFVQYGLHPATHFEMPRGWTVVDVLSFENAYSREGTTIVEHVRVN
jgi:hypothetical protein